MKDLFGVSLLLAWLRLCQNQATRAQSEACSYEFAYSNNKVISSGPKIYSLNSENIYELPKRPSITLICIQALAELSDTS